MKETKAFKTQLARNAYLRWVNKHAHNVICAAGMSQFVLHDTTWLKLPSKSAMEIVTDHKYLYASIAINEDWASKLWVKKDYEELLLVLCHEIAHIATSEADDNLIYKSCSKDRSFYFERLTELTSRWLYGYYRKHYMKTFNILLETGEIHEA